MRLQTDIFQREKRPMRHLLFSLLFLLTACGPMYQTDYQMVPPDSQEGRLCANNCLLANQVCEQQCRTTGQQCRQNEDLRAENEYLRERNEALAKGKQPKDDSYYSRINHFACADDDECTESCQAHYRICHTNCGGQAIPHTYCVAFCN